MTQIHKCGTLFTLLFFCVFDAINANAQWEWGVKSINSNSGSGTGMQIEKTLVDKSGNVYVLANFNCDTITFGALSLYHGLESVFMLKVDSSGNFLWVQNMNGAFGDMAFDNSGNIWVFGRYGDSSFTIGAFTLHQATPYQPMSYLAKISQAGSVLFAQNVAPIGHSAYNGTEGGIGIDNSNNIYVTCDFHLPHITIGSTTLNNTDVSGVTTDVFIAKCDSSGNWIWATSFGGDSTDFPYSLAVTGTGDFYVSGQYSHSITIADTTLTNDLAFFFSPFLIHYDKNGIALWAKRPFGFIMDMKTDIGGDLYTTSGFNSIGPLIVKYDLGGTVLWDPLVTNVFGTGTGLSIDQCGNIWVCGSVSPNYTPADTFYLWGHTFSYSPGWDIVFLAEFDASGNSITAVEIPNGYIMKDIGTDNYSNVYIAAYSNPYELLMSFGNDTFPVNQDYMFIAKYKYDTAGCNETTSVPGIPVRTMFAIYPNPASTTLTITAQIPITQITISNLLGQTIFSNNYNAEKVEVAVAGWPNGVYFVKVNGNEVRKFVKE